MIHRLPIQFTADAKKVVLLYFDLSTDRLNELIRRLGEQSESECETIWQQTKTLFEHRHRNFLDKMDHHLEIVEKKVKVPADFSAVRRNLLGAYVTKEYSTQSAALFNPSIVLHPDQDNLEADTIKFIMSLRSTGEGHISSITFKEGTIDANQQIFFNSTTAWQSAGTVTPGGTETTDQYQITFASEHPMSERILWPSTGDESMGMEDLRLVRFFDGRKHTYLGTYTAYDGRKIASKIMQTDDFQTFEIHCLKGNAIQGKGIAIFPRKINGKFAAIGRQDGVNMTFMTSNELFTWDHQQTLQRPKQPHELIQLGNCGSPIETPEGWLVLTHTVGPMRRYTLGASLLDLDHPERLIRQLTFPLLSPLESEREGYVPNVLYTCGWLQHLDHIFIPYAMSDAACSVARVSTEELLKMLLDER